MQGLKNIKIKTKIGELFPQINRKETEVT